MGFVLFLGHFLWDFVLFHVTLSQLFRRIEDWHWSGRQYFSHVTLQLRLNPSFVERVQSLSDKRLWLEIYPSGRSLPTSKEQNSFLAVNQIWFLDRTLSDRKASLGVIGLRRGALSSRRPCLWVARVCPSVLTFHGMVRFVNNSLCPVNFVQKSINLTSVIPTRFAPLVIWSWL